MEVGVNNLGQSVKGSWLGNQNIAGMGSEGVLDGMSRRLEDDGACQGLCAVTVPRVQLILTLQSCACGHSGEDLVTLSSVPFMVRGNSS